MKKLVIRTVAITVCAILLGASLLYGMFALFFPKALANAFYSMGANATAVKFYEKQCKKTEDFEDLYLLMVRGDSFNDSARLAKWGKVMVEKEGFSDFCKTKDGDGEITAEEIIEGKYVLALLWEENFAVAVDAAKKCVENEYTEYNPFYMLYAEPNTGVKASAFTSVIAILNEMMSSFSEQEKVFAKADINAMYLLQAK